MWAKLWWSIGTHGLAKRFGPKDKIEQFNLRTVAKDILDNHCSEWTMDCGNSGGLER